MTGDKPIETIGEVGKTALTGSTSTVLKQAAAAAGLIDSMTQTLGPEAVKAFMLWIFKTVDTELARRIQGQKKRTEGGGRNEN